MELPIIKQSGEISPNKLQVSDQLFSCVFNEGLVHQVVTAYMAKGRAGTKAQKTRRQVRGGGIKPWKQKGTGRARAGSIRSPLWRGGGRAFAACPRSYAQKVNKKMYRSALCGIFSELIRQNRLKIVDQFVIEQPKTKALVEKLTQLDLTKVLIIVDNEDQNLYLAAGNIPKVEINILGNISPVSLVAYDQVLLTADTLKKIEESLQ